MRRRELLSGGGLLPGRIVINGYEAVDLGLPSGLLWATCDVGATKETDIGNTYMCGVGATKCPNGTYYSSTATTTIPLTADTARQVMGEPWRMPTSAECAELALNYRFNNCDNDVTEINGIIGVKFFNNSDGIEKYVFIAGDSHDNASSMFYIGSSNIYTYKPTFGSRQYGWHCMNNLSNVTHNISQTATVGRDVCLRIRGVCPKPS